MLGFTAYAEESLALWTMKANRFKLSLRVGAGDQIKHEKGNTRKSLKTLVLMLN